MSIETRTRNGVAFIGISRPEKKNAITASMYAQMADALADAEDDAKVRAVLIHGREDVFTAGNDLEEFMKSPPAGEDAEVFDFMRVLGGAEKPVVAAVNGAALGIGTTMLMHCDLVYCGDDAVFSMPFVNLGLCPEFAASLLLPLNAGYHTAAEKLLLGESFGPEEAVEMRIVNRVLPRGEVLAHAEAQAARFNRLPPTAVRVSKRLLRQSLRSLTERAIRDEAGAFGELLRGKEAREAFAAFFERREPDFDRNA